MGATRKLKIVITGPESTGKSTLSELLAKHYNTMWVPEYAREYLSVLKRPYTQEDLLTIADVQLASIDRVYKESKRMVFVDTDLSVIKVWHEHKFGPCPKQLIEKYKDSTPDLYLLTNIDIPWEYDPLREHPDKREYFMGVYIKEMEETGVPFQIIKGDIKQRLAQSVAIIDRLL